MRAEPARHTVAVVESATQLLNVAEWLYAARTERGQVRVDVLPPCDPVTVGQVARIAELMHPLGVPVRVLPVRRRTPARLTALARAAFDLRTARRLVVGDPFSRLQHALLPLTRAGEVVVVDDGTATWQFLDCVRDAAPMLRWDLGGGPAGSGTGGRHAARATAFFTPAATRRLTVFSALTGSPPVGVGWVGNDYAWLRSLGRATVLDGRVDVVGVSLVDSGLVRAEEYVRTVARIADTAGSVRYLPHRRESAGLVGRIAALTGVTVHPPRLPVEVELRTGDVAATVIAFPSTAAHTLPVVLADLDVRVQVLAIEPAWFTPSAAPSARAFVARIADSAPTARG